MVVDVEGVFFIASIFFMLAYAVLLILSLFKAKSIEVYFYGQDVGHMIAMKNGGLPYLLLRSGLYGFIFILYFFNHKKYDYYFINNRVSGVSFSSRLLLSLTLVAGAMMFVCALVGEIFFY